MKRTLAVIMAALMLGSVTLGCSSTNSASSAPAESSETGTESAAESEAGVDPSDITIGVCIYKFDDTFMTGVRDQMTKEAEEMGVTLNIVDSQNKQATQNEQVDTFLTKGVTALCVNPVDRTAAESLVKKAKDKNIPIVFINREPEADVLNSYDKAWYVGAKAEQSGTLSGELIVNYFKEHPEADRNGDGKIQYVMLQGEPGHQDATLRTQYSIQALEDAGFETEKLAADTAYWDKAKATDLMNTFITSQGIEKIEAVLSNNDDMALGAIEALKAHGYNKGDESKYIPVVGVDATAPALEAMKQGSMYGTVLNDAVNQGTAAVHIAVAAAQGKEITEDTIGYELTDNKYVWIPYVQVTQDNYEDYMG
jgi:methyl-galactoside transport system substrate-binding protein